MRIGGYDGIQLQYGNAYADQPVMRGSVRGPLQADLRPGAPDASNGAAAGTSGATSAPGSAPAAESASSTGPERTTGLESAGTNASADARDATGKRALAPEEEIQVKELKRRDTEVRAHEQAHIAAGGSYVRGGAHFEYEMGPDGKQYATGGEVGIDLTPVSGNPAATIGKMQTVIKAALAPAQPSAQDRGIAAQAAATANEARTELLRMRGASDYAGIAGASMGTSQAKGANFNAVA